NVRISGPSRPPLEAVVFSEMWGVAYQRQAYSGGATAVQMPDRNIFDCMRNLNLVQTFKPGRVEPWMVERILDVGMWGPTPENFKQWRYIVVKDQASKEFLHKLTEERKYTPFYFSDTEWQHARTWYMDKEQRLARVDRVLKEGPSPWLRQADTLIIVATPPRAWVDSAYLPNVVALRNPISFIATGCCVQNMMLGATALGLGVNYDPTPVHDARNEETIREYFGIPSSWTPMGILCLGEPGERLERAPAPPVEALVFDDYWGNNHRGPNYSI
ncbi:MAG: nitroreductase family protein, partial [Chloroflexota bacterium]|nr:nitroreductase family protein [Chloroflexota bacterium]